MGYGNKEHVTIKVDQGLKQEVDSLTSELAQTETQINEVSGRADNPLNRINDGSIPNTKLKPSSITQNELSEEVRQQMVGNTPLNAVPADGSLITAKYANGSITFEKIKNTTISIFDEKYQYLNSAESEGTMIEVSKTIADTLKNLSILGKSTQSGTPSPSAPKSIVSSCSNELKISITTQDNKGSINTVEIPITEPLRSLPNGIRDVVKRVDGIWGIERKVKLKPLNDFSWGTPAPSNGFNRFSCVVSEAKASTVDNILVTHFPVNPPGNWVTPTKEGLNTGASLNGGFHITFNGATTSDEFKTWAINNNVQIQYELVTPIFTPFADQHQALLDNVKTYLDYTKVTLNNVNKPSISFRYPINITLASSGGGGSTTSHLQGKKVVCFGDSITGSYLAPNDYPSVLQNRLGVTAYNVGFSGCRMADRPILDRYRAYSMVELVDAIVTGDWSYQDEQLPNASASYPAQLERLKSINFNEIDIVTIFYGANDFGGNVPKDNEAKKFDITTYLGATRYSVKTLLENFPHLKIVLLSVTWRLMPASLLPCDDEPNSNGDYNRDYVDALMNTGKELQIPVIDMFYGNQINRYNYTQYLSDGLHPNDPGVQLLGNRIASSIQSIL